MRQDLIIVDPSNQPDEPLCRDEAIAWATDAEDEDVREFCLDLLRAANIPLTKEPLWKPELRESKYLLSITGLTNRCWRKIHHGWRRV